MELRVLVAAAGLSLALGVATATLCARPPFSVEADSIAPEFVDVRTTAKRSSGGQQRIEVETPPGEAGDLLIAAVALARDRTVAAPAGWALVDSGVADEDEARLVIWYRLAGETEEASHVFTWEGRARGGAAILRYRGVDPATPLGATAFATGETRDPPTAPGVVTTRGAARIVRLFAVFGVSITTTEGPPTGHEERFFVGAPGSNGVVAGGADTTLDIAGPSGTATFNLDIRAGRGVASGHDRGQSPTGARAHAHAYSHTDSHAYTDPHANADPPADSDSHAYTDPHANADPHADSDSHTNADSNTNADSHTDADSHANTDSYADAYPHADADAHSDAYSHTHANSHSNAYPHSNSDTNAYPHANAYSHANAYPHADAYSHTDTYPHANAHSHANAYPHTDAHSHANAYPHPDSQGAEVRRRGVGVQEPARRKAGTHDRHSTRAGGRSAGRHPDNA